MKKFLMFLLIIVVFFLGMFLAPYPALHYDPLDVQGTDYGLSSGDYVVKGDSIQVRRVFSPKGLTFIQTPDGTFYLATDKNMEETAKSIKAIQSGKYNHYKATIVTLYARLMQFRAILFKEITDLIT